MRRRQPESRLPENLPASYLEEKRHEHADLLRVALDSLSPLDRDRRASNFARLAAAAALLFFFFAGAGREVAVTSVASVDVEQAYAQLDAASSELDGLLPD